MCYLFMCSKQRWLFSRYAALCHTVAYFEWNLHTQIFGGDSILNTTLCGDHIVDTIMLYYGLFERNLHYDITIGNDVARDVHFVTS